ncbi:MAG: hypothetical protein EON96_18530 [Caulobacteraceae bacterium]|nr:MAG: hypothetical protein EON96_18530 [Caulobacteraceae bacterium]
MIYTARWKAGLLCGGLLLPLLLLPAELREDQAIWWVAGAGILIGAYGLLLLVNPARLILSEEGFECRGPGRPLTVRWRDIETLGIWRTTRQTVVVWVLRPGVRQKGVMARLNRLFNFDDGLHGLWALRAPELLAVMKQYHASATRPGSRLSRQGTPTRPHG